MSRPLFKRAVDRAIESKRAVVLRRGSEVCLAFPHGNGAMHGTRQLSSSAVARFVERWATKLNVSPRPEGNFEAAILYSEAARHAARIRCRRG